MFYLFTILVVIFTALSVFLYRKHGWSQSNYWKKQDYFLFWSTFISVGLFIGLVVPTVVTLNSQNSDLNALATLNADRALYIKQEKFIQEVVAKELDRYPEIEAQIIGEIQPDFLLSFPELNSNETIIAKAKELKEARQALNDIEFNRNTVLYRILTRETGVNFFSPFADTYQERYGTINPLLQEIK